MAASVSSMVAGKRWRKSSATSRPVRKLLPRSSLTSPAQVFPVLLEQRPVEPEGLRTRARLSGVARSPRIALAGIAGQSADEEEDDERQPEQDRDEEQQSSEG